MGSTAQKIGLILQGQDSNANSGLLEGVKSVLPADRVDLRVFFTDNKFSTERRCLQTVVHQHFDGFIIDGVKASLLNPNLDCYQEIYRRRIPVIFYNNYYKNLHYPRVIVNDMECADRLIGLLVQAGHRQIAGIFVYDNYQSIEKFQGTTAALIKRGWITRTTISSGACLTRPTIPVLPAPLTAFCGACPSILRWYAATI